MSFPPSERIEYSRPPDLPGVEILRAAHSSRLWRVCHETYTVCIVQDSGRGGAEWVYRHRGHLARTGGVMLMEPGEIHCTTKVLAPGTLRVLWIDPSWVERAAEELGLGSSDPHWSMAQLYDPSLFRMLAALHASVERPGRTLERQSRFAACLRRLFEQCSSGLR